MVQMGRDGSERENEVLLKFSLELRKSAASLTPHEDAGRLRLSKTIHPQHPSKCQVFQNWGNRFITLDFKKCILKV